VADPNQPAFLLGGGVTGELIRSIDWSKTAVGPIDGWPESLKTLVGTMLHSRHFMFLWWGPELIQFYNDAYLPSFGKGKHPAAMGQRGADCWQEIWPIISPQIDDVMTRGIATWNEDQLVPIFRNGRLEEVYWTYSYSPAFREGGIVGGTLVVGSETTKRVLADRRIRSVRLLSDLTGSATDPKQVFRAAAEATARAREDIPFALIYLRDKLTPQAIRVATLGVDEDVALRIEAGLGDRLAGVDLRGARPGQSAGHVEELAFPIVAGPWPEPIDRIFVADVPGPVVGTTAGFVVFGLSARLPFDRDYQDYLESLIDQLPRALERIEAFRARTAAESERRNLLLQAPVATALMAGPKHRFELANPLYKAMVGREVIGKSYLEAFPELAGTALPEILDRVFWEGEPFVTNELLVPLVRADGVADERFFKFNLEPIRDLDGMVYGMMALAIDVSEQVVARRAMEKTHREHERLLAELESASRTKDEFLAMLGHELRNPLAPIVTALELMKLRSDGIQSRAEQIIERQVKHLVRLVDDLLDISKITRGKIELKRETVELADVVGKAVEMASVLLEQRRHELVLEVPRTGLLWYGDPVRLAQVLANLLTNAARYTEPQGRIVISAVSDGTEIVIRVRDNGIGIAPEMLPRIFDMFVQARRSADRAEGGLGLGLTLAKTLVIMHGGTMTASSDGEGKGTELEIRLPARRQTVPKVADVVAPPSPARRVLVVDDNADAGELLAETLRFRGHHVTVALDPLAALTHLATARPEVAVLDIGLPVMDGYELAAQVHALVPECRLVALTGYGQQQDVERSRKAGFFGHLVKPVDIDQLLRFVALGAQSGQP